jgi:hypothetical protein
VSGAVAVLGDTRCRLAASGDADGSPISPNVSLLASLELEHAVLHLLERGGPLGSGTLMEELQEFGYRGSEPTVGRFLRTLDRRGLFVRASNKGRELSERGRERPRELCEAEDQLF